MSQESPLILYGSQCCQLCEHAKDVIYQLPSDLGVQFVEQDILLDDQLFDRYRYSIPVLKKQGTDEVLAWPFDLKKLLNWLT